MEQESTKITKRFIPGCTLTPRDGYYQIRKIGLTAARVKKDPAFGRTRQHAKEFGAMVKIAQSIVAGLLPHTGIKVGVRRLSGLLFRATQADATNPPGSRSLLQGNWQALEGFDLNARVSLKDTIHKECSCKYHGDRAAISLYLPSIIPAVHTVPPEGATHFRIKAVVITVKGEQEVEAGAWRQSTLLPVKNVTVPPVCLSFNVDAQPSALQLVILYLQWYLPGKDNASLSKSKTPGALNIVKVLKTGRGMFINR